MRSILLIGHNDLRLFLRNRSAWIWLFVVPLLFVYFMGAANRGPGGPSRPRPALRVENADSGFLGAAFLEELGLQGLEVVSPTNAARARRGIRIPADFTRSVLEGRQAKVEFEARGTTEDAASAMVELRVLRAVVALNAGLLELAGRTGGAQPTAEAWVELRGRPDAVVLDARFGGRRPIPTGFNLSLPGVLVMYLMMNLLVFGGTALGVERRGGVLWRVMVFPVARASLLAGKLYGLLLLAVVQIIYLLVTGRYLFGVDLGEHWGGIAVVLMVYAWVAASMGVLVASVVRGEDKITGLCVLASLVMAALGGCWWPLEILPDTMKVVARCVPTGWAMEALHQLITFGNGLPSAGRSLVALAGFGLAANLGAMRFFRV